MVNRKALRPPKFALSVTTIVFGFAWFAPGQESVNKRYPVPELHSLDMVQPVDDVETGRWSVTLRFSKEPEKNRRLSVIKMIGVPPNMGSFANNDFPAPTMLEIEVVSKHGEDCLGNKTVEWWSGTARSAPVVRRYYRYLGAPPPVLVVYPPVEFARPLSLEQFNLNSLPKGISVSAIDGAIDLDGDGQPDLLVVEHRCGDSPNERCRLKCYGYYQKRNGAWTLIQE
jgi:hypothetical protein